MSRTTDRGGRERRSGRSGAKRALIVLGMLVLVVAVAVAGFVGYLGYTVNDNITQEALLPEERPPVTAPDGQQVAETGTGTNFLVVGADNRGDGERRQVRRHRAHPRPGGPQLDRR